MIKTSRKVNKSNTYNRSNGNISFFISIWIHYLDANKTAGEEARRQLHKNVESNIE